MKGVNIRNTTAWNEEQEEWLKFNDRLKDTKGSKNS